MEHKTKTPTAQEIISNIDMGIWQWVEWYNFRLKMLNPKPDYYPEHLNLFERKLN